MVWTEKAPVIVMITKLWEKSKSKCEPYFPMELNTSVTYGPFIVTTMAINNKDGYIVRTTELQVWLKKYIHPIPFETARYHNKEIK